MSKFYLVTGGTGFIGAALVRSLLASGNRVRILDNQSRGATRRLSGIEKEVELLEADIRNYDEVERAMHGIDSVCHLAFVNGTEFFYSKPELVLDVGVKGMVNVVDAAIKKGVGELVLASSSEVYQQPLVIPTDETVALTIPDVQNPRYSYAAGKLISEVMAINYGRQGFERVLIFRPHNVYGCDMGWEHVIPQFALRMKELISKSSSSAEVIDFPIQGTGEESRSFIYIDDFIDGVSIMLKEGQHLGIYHIGTSEEISMANLARVVAKYFDRAIEIRPGEPARGGANRRCPDVNKMRALGFNPTISLEEGVRRTIQWYDANLHLKPTGDVAVSGRR